MAGDSQLERFLKQAGLPLETQFALRGFLDEELPASNLLLLVQCGPNRSLLHVMPEALVFYFIESRADGPVFVRTVRIAPPRRARIHEERQLRDSHLQTTKLVAKHDAFPEGQVECDCSGLLEEATVAQVRELFHSWAEAAPRRQPRPQPD